MSNELINYNLPTDAYLNFDAESFKSYMIEKLSENEWFTDQNFVGSNLNNLLDILVKTLISRAVPRLNTLKSISNLKGKKKSSRN